MATNDETRAAINLDDFAGHTPGPWKAFCRDTGYVEGEPWSEDRFLQWDIEGPEEPDGRGTFFEKDARLVAAAPDLLAEVRRLRAANAELAAALRLSLDAMDAVDACLSQSGVGYSSEAEQKRKAAERAGDAALARHDAGKGAAS